MSAVQDIKTFLDSWEIDPLQAKPDFIEFMDYLSSQPNVALDFKSRPHISYSLRARNASQKNRELFVLVDVVDDEPDSRWLSVCFYADMVSDPEENGDFVPSGLLGEDAICFNLDEDDPAAKEYVMKRLREASQNAAK